jgi:hypothetical protein
VTLLLLALAGGSRVQGQLVADVRQFLGTLPTFYSVDRGAASPPQTPGPASAASVNLLSVATNATALMNRRATCPAGWGGHARKCTRCQAAATQGTCTAALFCPSL